MQYVLALYTDEAAMARASAEEIKAHLDAYGEFIRGVVDRGILQFGAPLQPTPTATTVRVREKETLITDGPFAETKEQLAGFFVVECDNLDEAIELASKIPSAAVGSVEVRPLWDQMHERMQSPQ